MTTHSISMPTARNVGNSKDAADCDAAKPGLSRRRVLIVEDNPTARQQLKEILSSDSEMEVEVASDGREALRQLESDGFSAVVTDLRMPGMSGMDLIRAIQDRRLDVSVIVTTGHGSLSDAVEAMRLGADDFLTKPIDIDHLQLVLRRILRERKLRDEVSTLRQQLHQQYAFQNVISKSPRMLSIFELIGNIADTNTTVLIEGETGTGKEQIARAIHLASLRKDAPLVAVNCAALPETLLESELFGHEKGAFTGAVSRRIGRFEAAHGGTLFLDEVGDIPPTMQAKLLRVLQERRFERVGGIESVEVDVRVIAATNKSLRDLVESGDFREDLYYRLNVVRIELPPLRERSEDIPLLVGHFAARYARPGEAPKEVEPDAMESLLKHQWSGNVRELENVIEYACVTSRGGTIGTKNLPATLGAPARQPAAPVIDLSRPLTDTLAAMIAATEKAYIIEALTRSHGNVGKCARLCGLSRRSISAKLSQYAIDKARYK